MSTDLGKLARSIGALILVIALATTGSALARDGQEPVRAFATVNGTEVPLVVGMVIAKGTLRTDGVCNIPMVTVGARVSNAVPTHARITVETTSNCEMVVKEIVFDQSASPSLPAGKMKLAEPTVVAPSIDGGPAVHVGILATSYRVWGESVYRDPVRIPLTSVHGELSYYDDGSQVYGGYNRSNYCWWLPDGWSNTSCYYTWDPNGPSSVYSQTDGSFQWTGGLWPHWHWVKALGYPNNEWGVGCQTQGDTVPGGLWTCDGGR